MYRHSDGSLRDFPEWEKEKFFSGLDGVTIINEKPNTFGKKDAIGDLNKPRLSLIPKRALWALGGALTYGEKHYGTHNWRKGIKVSYLLDAALRHINEFNAGENIDQKSQNHHLGNAMANLAMAIELSETNPELDDRYGRNNEG
jgi:hypothetical protein